jgi:hypothetical protein
LSAHEELRTSSPHRYLDLPSERVFQEAVNHTHYRRTWSELQVKCSSSSRMQITIRISSYTDTNTLSTWAPIRCHHAFRVPWQTNIRWDEMLHLEDLNISNSCAYPCRIYARNLNNSRGPVFDTSVAVTCASTIPSQLFAGKLGTACCTCNLSGINQP